MGDNLAGTGTPSPPIAETVLELHGCFPSDAALEDAIHRLELCGFARNDLSLPVPVATRNATPEAGAEDPHADDDNQQMRTLHTSLAGSAAALLAAGVVVGTGGLAAPAVVAAVAAGAAAGGVAFTASKGSDQDQHEQRQALAAQGALLLAVRIADEGKLAVAENAMRAAGATRIDAVVRD